MNWILACSLMFISSIFMYLSIRKSTILKTPTEFNNLAMMALPVIFYLIIGVQKIKLSITLTEFIIIVISAIMFSYLGNLFSLKSMEYAPNPGYSLVISKSYVIFTTIVSVYLFNSQLTFQSAIAICFIILSSILLVTPHNSIENKGNSSKKWLILSLGAFFCWGMLALTSKYLLIIGVDILTRLIYSMTISSFIILLEMGFKKTKINKISPMQSLTLFFIGIFATTFNYFMQVGFDLAPNIGYVNAINTSSIAGVTLFSSILFKDELSGRKYLGVLGVIFGITLIIL